MSVTYDQIPWIFAFIWFNVFIMLFKGKDVYFFYEYGYGKMPWILKLDDDWANLLLFISDSASAVAMITLFLVLDIDDTDLKVAFSSLAIAQMLFQLWKYFYWVRRAHALASIVSFASWVISLVADIYTWISVSDTIGSNSNGYLSGSMTILTILVKTYFGIANTAAWWFYEPGMHTSAAERMSLNGSSASRRKITVSSY
jgi:hypothetical protein